MSGANPSGGSGDSRGYYSYDIGEWHIISLNSNVDPTPQIVWLRDDLAATRARCVLAYWHHPVFSSAHRGGDPFNVSGFWSLLYEYRADVVVNGHDHVYERLAPQNAAGAADAYPRRVLRSEIAVRNFNENLSILVMLSTYAGLLWLNLSIYIVIVLFGAFVAGMMVLVRRHHLKNVRRGGLPTIPSEAHH